MLKKLILLALLGAFFVVGCVPTDTGAETVATATPASTDSGAIELLVRVRNETPTDLAEVTLQFANSEVTFTAIPAGADSDYQAVDEAYQSVRVILGEGEAQTMIDAALESGEPPITAGAYSYIIQSEANLANATVQMMPDTAYGFAQIEPVVDLIFGTSSDVVHQPSIQRGTPFDAAAGATVSAREILEVAGNRVDVYYFADAATAAQMAAGIEPGGTRLTLTDPSGQPHSESLTDVAGPAPSWWQTGRYLILYAGNTPTIIDRLTEAFGTPLVAQAPGTLAIRVANLGPLPMDEVTVNFVGQEVAYGALDVGDFSGYETVTEAYRYAGLDIVAEGGPYNLMPIDYVGETPLVPGRYTYYLSLENGQLRETMIADDDWHIADGLLDVNWYWVAGDGAQGPEADEGRWPFVSFTAETSPNQGEIGWQFGGFTSCNGMGGTYFTNSDGALVIPGIGQTEAACAEPVMAAEGYFTGFLRGINYFEAVGSWLFMVDGAGDRLMFTTAEPATPYPYDRSEPAALAELLAQLWPETQLDLIQPLPADVAPNATGWGLTVFDEPVTVLVYEDAAAVTSGRGQVPEGRLWVTGRYLLIYNGENEFIDQLFDRMFGAS
ncbi:MAG: META domain-containing protein [Ardenticatenales bacterium]|nr:META domain-containing protein [Ardenticatenales bacterium]